ncbi:MAG: nicotinamide-nucleotide amidase [Bacteriovoracaceae bacterium]
MKAKLIIIGNELLYGRIRDTNGPWLAKWLDNQGIELEEILVVKDDEKDLLEAFERAWNSSDLIITSGGIGPTLDDMTKALLARFFKKELLPSKEAEAIVVENYKYYDRSWTPELNTYHHIPEGFIVTPNPKGLAPGLVYQAENKMIMAAPGVPRELQAMAEVEFLPLIKEYFKGRFEKKHRTVIRTSRVPEEKIFGELCPSLWKDLSAFGSVSSLPQIIGVDIIVTMSEENALKNEELIKEYIKNSNLAEHVWQWGNEKLPELVVKEALEKGIKFSFAESCTGGLAASRITDVPGSSGVLLSSLVTYSNDAKTNILGVGGQTIKKYGAVSIETVKEMVVGVRDKTGADMALAFSGIAGPTGGSVEKPIGTLALSWANKTEVNSEVFHFSGDRERLKLRFSEIGLFKLLQMIRAY